MVVGNTRSLRDLAVANTNWTKLSKNSLRKEVSLFITIFELNMIGRQPVDVMGRDHSRIIVHSIMKPYIALNASLV